MKDDRAAEAGVDDLVALTPRVQIDWACAGGEREEDGVDGYEECCLARKCLVSNRTICSQ